MKKSCYDEKGKCYLTVSAENLVRFGVFVKSLAFPYFLKYKN